MWELTLLAWSWHHLKLLLCSVSMNYLTWLQCHPWYPSTTSNSQMHAAANAQQLRMRMKQKQTPWKEINLQSTNFAMLIALSKILTNHGNICIPVPFSVGDIEAVHRAFSIMQGHSVEHSHCVVSCQARCKATRWFESTRWNGHVQRHPQMCPSACCFLMQLNFLEARNPPIKQFGDTISKLFCGNAGMEETTFDTSTKLSGGGFRSSGSCCRKTKSNSQSCCRTPK